MLSKATILHHMLCVEKFYTHQTGRFDSFDLMTGYSAIIVIIFFVIFNLHERAQLFLKTGKLSTMQSSRKQHCPNIMDQYLSNIMLHLKKELTTGDGDVETTLKLWRQYHNTLATVVSPPYLGYTKVEIYYLS